MGTAITRALLAAGHDVHVWNRTPAKLAPLVAAGAHACATVADAVAASDAIVVMVRDYAASDALLREVRGKLVVELTSGTPAQARGRQAWVAANDITYIDGVVLVTPNLVGTERCVVLAAGAPAPAWLGLGGRVIHVGDSYGQAAALDLALIGTLWGAMFSTLWGARIVEAERVPLALYTQLSGALEPIIHQATRGLLARIAGDRSEPERASLEVHRVGIAHLREACDTRGISTALADAFAAPIARAAHGDDFADLIRYL